MVLVLGISGTRFGNLSNLSFVHKLRSLLLDHCEFLSVLVFGISGTRFEKICHSFCEIPVHVLESPVLVLGISVIYPFYLQEKASDPCTVVKFAQYVFM